MAQEVVVADTLSDEMIEAGDALMRHLDASHIGVSAAFWFLMPETEAWRLFLAMPVVQKLGPRASYRLLLRAIHKQSPSAPKLALHDITVVEEDHPLVVLFTRLLRARPDAVLHARLARCMINGVFIPDALVYRLPHAASESASSGARLPTAIAQAA